MQTVVVADRLFDGTGAALIQRAVMVITEGRVTAVGEVGQIAEPPGAKRLHFPGCTLVPGLIDRHVHLVLSASGSPLADLLSEDDLSLMARSSHRSDGASSGEHHGRGPRGTRGRHTGTAGRDSARCSTRRPHPGRRCSYHHHRWQLLLARWGADGAEGLRKRVRPLHRAGVDLIKVMSSGSRMTAGNNVCAAEYTIEELKALVDESPQVAENRRSTRARRGWNQKRGGRRCQRGRTLHLVIPEASHRVEYDEHVADTMAQHGIFMAPTLVGGMRLRNADPATLTPLQHEGRELRPHVLTAHRRSIELEVEIAAGTDAGVGNTVLDSLPEELRIYNEFLGLSPADCLRAASYNVARSAGVEADLGSLRSGWQADFLVVPGNPLEDLAALAHLPAVYKDGELEVEDGRLIRS